VHSSRVPTVLAASQQRLLLLLASLDIAVLGVLGKAMKLSVQLKSRGLPGQGHGSERRRYEAPRTLVPGHVLINARVMSAFGGIANIAIQARHVR